MRATEIRARIASVYIAYNEVREEEIKGDIENLALKV